MAPSSTSSNNQIANGSTSTNAKAQKHFEQLRRLILGRNPSLDEIRQLVTMNPLCIQQRDPHHGLSPLHWSVVFQNPLSIVQYFAEVFPAAITEIDKDGRLPLHHACRQDGNPALVAFLIEQNPRLATQRDHRGKTPLHCACMEGVPSEIPRLLLQANSACAKIRTRDGQTALHLACEANAPSTTIQLLVDAYPEAVKYLTDANTGKFAQAKEYLALKVKQTEEEADRHAAAVVAEQQQQQQQNHAASMSKKTSSRYDPHPTRTVMNEDSTMDINSTNSSDHVDEFQIELEGEHFSSLAKQQHLAALLRLKEQELDVAQKAAELDRLIQQKEAHLESGRFQKESQRIYAETGNSPPRPKQQRHLNDSGIGRSRSFNAALNVNLNGATNTDISTTAQLLNADRQPNSINHGNPAPPIELSPRGVSVETDFERVFDEDEDDAYFQSLRQPNKQSNTFASRDNTKPLYQESKLLTGESSSWAASGIAYSTSNIKGRDPSIETSTIDQQPVITEANPDESHLRLVGIREPSPPPPSHLNNGNVVSDTTQTPSIQEQLKQALEMLEHAEERRREEINDAQKQQAKLQDELAKLMLKLEVNEKNRAAAVDKESTQERQAEHEDEAQREWRKQQQQAMPPQQQPSQLPKQHPPERQRPGRPPETLTSPVVRGHFGSVTDTPSRIFTTADSTYPGHSMGYSPLQYERQQQRLEKPKVGALSEAPTSPNDFLKDHQGRTPLHIALANGPSYTVVQFLLQQFPLSIYQIDHSGNTPLHCACLCPNMSFEILQVLVEIFPAATLLANANQQLPIHLACQHHGQRVEVLQLLLDIARSVEHDFSQTESDEQG